MKLLNADLKKIEFFNKGAMGVFSTSDLKNLFNETNGLKLNRRIKNLQESGILTRFSKGIYTTTAATLYGVSTRIQEGSYVSLASALSKHLMIGTLPSKTVFAVRCGRTQTFSSALGKIVYVSSQPDLMFGYIPIDGIDCATPEKALLDMLYYHQKGRQFYFDIYTDVNVSCIDIATIRSHLGNYKNPRFTAFVEGYLNDRLPR